MKVWRVTFEPNCWSEDERQLLVFSESLETATRAASDFVKDTGLHLERFYKPKLSLVEVYDNMVLEVGK